MEILINKSLKGSKENRTIALEISKIIQSKNIFTEFLSSAESINLYSKKKSKVDDNKKFFPSDLAFDFTLHQN